MTCKDEIENGHFFEFTPMREEKESFRWIGPCEVTVDEILSGVKQKHENKTQTAKQLILTMLAGGKEVYNRDVEAATVAKGIKPRMLRDAKKEFGEKLKSRIVENYEKVSWREQS